MSRCNACHTMHEPGDEARCCGAVELQALLRSACIGEPPMPGPWARLLAEIERRERESVSP